jgi:hypothetical protein
MRDARILTTGKNTESTCLMWWTPLDYGPGSMRLRVDVLCPLVGIVFGIAVACSGQERTSSSDGSPMHRAAAISALQHGSTK